MSTLSPFLVLRAQSGDRRALEELLRGIQPELLGYLSRLVRDPHRAEDALQDTLLIIVRQLRSLREARFFRTWAYRIATREAFRVMAAPTGASTEAMDCGPGPLNMASDREAIAEVLRQVDRLPPNSRAIVLLHYGAGMSLSAAAAAMEIPEGTAKSRLGYALNLLRNAPTRTPETSP